MRGFLLLALLGASALGPGVAAVRLTKRAAAPPPPAASPPAATAATTAQSLARVSENPSPSLEDNTYLHRTWGFLRASSDQVGSAASDVLDMQGRLAELQEDVTSEYKNWGETKTALVKENDRLRNTRAHLAGELQQQSNMEVELARHEHELAEVKAALDWEAQSQAAAEAEWEKERAVLEKGIKDIEAQMEAEFLQEKADERKVETERLELRQENAKLQGTAYDLNKQIVQLDGELSGVKIEMAKKHSKLIADNQAAMGQVKQLQKDSTTTAMVQHELLSLKARVGAQLSQKADQEGQANSMEKQCNEALQDLDAKIKEANAEVGQARKQIVECQKLDGENQQLQKEVNECHAANLA